jgi:succinate dehydrogenase / fumarate reductase cytochrome b subunit
MNNKERPVYISVSPFKFSFPFTALASIAHRVTGVLLFLGIGYLLWLLSLGLESEAGFAQAEASLAAPFAKIVLWAVLSMLIYHILAGVKHLLLDFHVGDTFEAATAATYAVVGLSAVLAIVTGAWIW